LKFIGGWGPPSSTALLPPPPLPACRRRRRQLCCSAVFIPLAACRPQAYRKLALVKHPDKNPDNPRAADEFAELQKAYDLLLDKEARAALDALVK